MIESSQSQVLTPPFPPPTSFFRLPSSVYLLPLPPTLYPLPPSPCLLSSSNITVSPLHSTSPHCIPLQIRIRIFFFHGLVFLNFFNLLRIALSALHPSLKLRIAKTFLYCKYAMPLIIILCRYILQDFAQLSCLPSVAPSVVPFHLPSYPT